jgi:peptidoglycan hydrolase-like protein with peptidoglycan-binding domain
MILWSASSMGKRVSLLGVLAVSLWLLTGTPANGQAATAPAASTAAAKKTIQTAQERLLALGYQPGSADGVMGARAIAALRKFQSDHSLPVTGQLDRKTLDALDAAPPAPTATTHGAAKPKAAPKPADSVSGTVSEVSVDPREGTLSVVIENNESHFAIPLDKFVELDSFKDLRGRETMMGGLLLLTPVNERIKGKNVTIEYIPWNGQYLITALRVEGLAPLAVAGRKFSGQVKLYNGMSEPVRNVTIQGLGAGFEGKDINPASGIVVFGEAVEIPPTIKIVWESTIGQKSQDIDLSVLQQTKEDYGTISLSLTPQGVWALEKKGF